MFFISYSSKDSILAHQLRARLERDGLTCWMAPEDIRAGQDYASEIPAAIGRCTAFLLLLTANAQSSRWVPKELDVAINAGKPVVPYHADHSTLTPAFDFKLINVQRIVAAGQADRGYGELLAALRRQLPEPVKTEPVKAEVAKPAKPKPSRPAPAPAPAPHQKKRSRGWIFAALLIAFIIAMGVRGYQLKQDQARPDPAPAGSAAVKTEVCTTCSGTGRCATCRGSGRCGACSGSGVSLITDGNCRLCFGSGDCLHCYDAGKCSACSGTGYRRVSP